MKHEKPAETSSGIAAPPSLPISVPVPARYVYIIYISLYNIIYNSIYDIIYNSIYNIIYMCVYICI